MQGVILAVFRIDARLSRIGRVATDQAHPATSDHALYCFLAAYAGVARRISILVGPKPIA
jgi:hypothetical protein